MKEIVATMDSNLTQSLLKLIDCFFTPFVPKEVRRRRRVLTWRAVWLTSRAVGLTSCAVCGGRRVPYDGRFLRL